MKTITNFQQLTTHQLQRLVHTQIRKAFLNAVISFVLITFIGHWTAVVAALIFAFLVMINCMKIDNYARELRRKKD